ncbi:hypothetical protein Tco_0287561 [Tanacetum coccineum]
MLHSSYGREKGEKAKDIKENQIVWESRQEDIKRSKPHALYGNTEDKRYVLSLHKIHTVPFPEDDLEEKMNRWIREEFKTSNEEARLSIQHWKDLWNKRIVTTKQQHELDFMEQIIVIREDDKPDNFSKDDFKSCLIWERVYDFQLGIESYRIRINLTAPTLIFYGIEARDPYSIIDVPRVGLIYLNNKEKKRVSKLAEIVKFCDATLERVLKEVKLKIFETEFLKKAPLLGDLNNIKTYEREIVKRLRNRKHMRRLIINS